MSPHKRSAEESDQLRATLVEHARQLIARQGAAALTMRALAAEAGCAVGLPYKVFADRREIVVEIMRVELVRLRSVCDELTARAGAGTVGGNLTWFADAVLDSPAVALTQELLADEALVKSVTASAEHTGVGPAALPAALTGYLAAEQRVGRVAADVDPDAYAFLLAGALHNLLVAGAGWPRPDRPELARILAAVAASIAPRS